jgi:hypothetical protein
MTSVATMSFIGFFNVANHPTLLQAIVSVAIQSQLHPRYL